MLDSGLGQASRSGSVVHCGTTVGVPPKRISAFIAASLITVLLSLAHGAASEQPATRTSRVRTSVASASAGAATDADAYAAAAAASSMRLRLVGEALATTADADLLASIAAVTQAAYLAAFTVQADAVVLPVPAVGGELFRPHILQ